jgi:GDP-4-dehydro-6-deoxy-D-mannose reductase
VRALITGAAGFVGRHLERHLRGAGDEVTAVDRDHDVTDLADLTRTFESAAPDVVFHLAALSHVGDSWDDPSSVLQVNVLGTNAVLTAARRAAPAALVVVVSSAEVYGMVGTDELPLSERSPIRPASPYAATKAAAEPIALQAWRGYGQRVIVVRPFNHIGPGQAPTFFVPALAHRLVAACAAGTPEVTVGNLSARRDFTDVRDVVRAYRLLAFRGAAGEVYNICSGRDVAIADVARRLADLAYPEARFVEDPALRRPVDVPVLRGDPRLLQSVTGWKPEIDLDETLRDVVADARANLGVPSI